VSLRDSPEAFVIFDNEDARAGHTDLPKRSAVVLSQIERSENQAPTGRTA
jgi:hypothetical protein